MISERNLFLDVIGRHLHRYRPTVPDNFNSTTYIERYGNKSYLDIYVRSRGCRHNYRGGCTMCDYWASAGFDLSKMADHAKQALDKIDFSPTQFVFGPSGSLFDEWEVPASVRRQFYAMLKPVNAKLYEFFTRAETITEDKVNEIANYLEPSSVSIEMGLETSDPWKLKYCINKAIEPGQITKAVKIIKRAGFSSCAYIMIGVPFLTASEAVADTISTIKWAFEQEIDYCAIFPVHVKPWTIVYWLYEHGYYDPVSLWSVLDILSVFSPRELEHIGISWHRPRPVTHPLYKKSSIQPTTCPKCFEKVASTLDAFRFSSQRANLIDDLARIDCECKHVWNDKLAMKSNVSIYERVTFGYQQMGRDILGEEWWQKHGTEVINNIPVR